MMLPHGGDDIIIFAALLTYAVFYLKPKEKLMRSAEISLI